jgi:predicted O-methyltransferase YrrM
MRKIKHLTPRYILARLKEIVYQHRNSHMPWLADGANEFLQTYIRPSDVVLEFGSGRSTIWLASCVSQLVSVESSPDWYRKVSDLLAQKNLRNVDYYYLEGDQNDTHAIEAAIVGITSQYEDNKFDFILVDGVCRDICTRESIRILRPGGILVIDNINRYLPSASTSPNSRSFNMGPDGKIWSDIAQTINTWRYHWISSGVTDTAIYFKPQNVCQH